MKFRISDDHSRIILKDSTKQEYHQLKLYLDRHVDGYRFMKRVKLGVWDGKVNLFNNGNILFGLWKEIMNCCKEYGFPFILENKDEFPKEEGITIEDVQSFCDEFFSKHKTKEGTDFRPYDHQVEAAYRILKNRYGIIEVATSGGKSLIYSIVVFYILRKLKDDAKFLLIVNRASLVTQFYNELMEYNYGYNKCNPNPINIRIDEIMSDHPRKHFGEHPNIFIGTFQSLEKWKPEFFKQFYAVACDESHTAKSVSITNIFNKCIGTSHYRFGMSGTYPRDTTAELYTIESVMGPKLYKIGAKILIDKGLISKLKIKALILDHNDKSFAEQVYNIRRTGKGKEAYDLERKYTQNSAKKLSFISKLVTKFKTNTLVLFHNIEYGEILYNYFRDNIQDIEFHYIDGSTNQEKREYIKKQMELTDGKPVILIASYGTLSTGVSIKAINNIVFADSPGIGNIKPFQSIGRGLRLHPDKERLTVFDLVDRFHLSTKNILYDHYLKRIIMYKNAEYPCDELKYILD